MAVRKKKKKKKKKERPSTVRKSKPTVCLQATGCQAQAEPCSAPPKGHLGYWRWAEGWTLGCDS